jgi:NAD-dependent SIR2 family protein deacetylase
MLERRCVKCRERKPLNEYPEKSTPGPAKVCKQCCAAARRPARPRTVVVKPRLSTRDERLAAIRTRAKRMTIGGRYA